MSTLSEEPRNSKKVGFFVFECYFEDFFQSLKFINHGKEKVSTLAVFCNSLFKSVSSLIFVAIAKLKHENKRPDVTSWISFRSAKKLTRLQVQIDSAQFESKL